MTGRPFPFFFAVAALLLAAGVLLSYFPVLSGGFVYDDHLLIEENPLVTGPDTGWGALLGRGYFQAADRGTGYYRPLTTLLFRVEWRLYGPRPLGFHLDNLGIHLGVCLGLLLLGIRLGAHRTVALACALLFAVHPACTESVAWISGRTDPLACLFMVGALLCFGAGLPWDGLGPPARGGRRHLLLAAVLLAGAGVLAKEIAFILPLPLAGLAMTAPPGRVRRRAWAWTGCCAVVAAGLFLAGRLVLRSGEETLFCGRGTLWQRILTFCALVPAYLEKIFLPKGFALARPVSLVKTPWSLAVVAGAAILLLAALGLGLALFRRNRAAAAGLALFLGAMAALSNAVPIPYGFREMDFPFFERYLYVPLAALLLAAAGLVPRKTKHAAAIAAVAVIFLAAAVLLPSARFRAAKWRDDRTLYLAALEAYPRSPTLAFNLGEACFRAGRYLEAGEAFRQAARLDPDLVMARVQEGVALHELGRAEEATALLEKVCEAHPENGQAWEALGYVHAGNRRFLEALECYARALPLLHNAPSTRASRDRAAAEVKAEVERAFVKDRDYAGMVSTAERVLRAIPGTAWAHEARGLALLALGREAEGVEALERAVTLDPWGSAWATRTLAGFYEKTGREEEARVLRARLERMKDRLPPSPKGEGKRGSTKR